MVVLSSFFFFPFLKALDCFFTFVLTIFLKNLFTIHSTVHIGEQLMSFICCSGIYTDDRFCSKLLHFFSSMFFLLSLISPQVYHSYEFFLLILLPTNIFIPGDIILIPFLLSSAQTLKTDFPFVYNMLITPEQSKNEVLNLTCLRERKKKIPFVCT